MGYCDKRQESVRELIISRPILVMIALAVGAFLVYLPSTACDFIPTWDDQKYVLENQTIRSFSWKNFQTTFSNPLIGGYFPLSTFSYAFDFALWGTDPWGYHLVNNLFHALNVGLVYLVLLRLGCSPVVSVVTALVFALHPVNVEAVVWISQRKTVLASFFFFLSLLAFLNHARTGVWRSYLAALLLFALALLSKTTTIALCVIVLAWFYREGRLREWYKSVPFFLLAVAGAVCNVWVSVTAKAVDSATISAGMLFGEIYPTMLAVYPQYFRLLFWPTQLSGFYDTTRHLSFTDVEVLTGVVLAIVIPLVAFCTMNRSFKFWMIWAIVCFLPMANIIPIQVYYADRFLYLSQIGVFVILVIGAEKVFKSHLAAFRFSRSLLIGCFVVVLFALTSLTYERIAVWNNDVTFWQDVVNRYPRLYNQRINLALAYENKGLYSKAAVHHLAGYNLTHDQSALWNYRRAIMLSKTETKDKRSTEHHQEK